MTAPSRLDEKTVKAHGIHYTPPELASFLAEVTVRQTSFRSGTTLVLDPACGDGGLLKALAQAAPRKIRERIELVGYETDATAAAEARTNLGELDVAHVDVRIGDFLDRVVADNLSAVSEPLFSGLRRRIEIYDIVISNPPYVRTQVLGAKESQRLASLFDLSGRVDLYHAFVKAISSVLCPGGILGLLTSNRFLSIQSGASVRELFRTNFELRDLYDLGDTKLFAAAVLPAILVAKRVPSPHTPKCSFTRVYEIRNGNPSLESSQTHHSLLPALTESQVGAIRTAEGRFRIERGELNCESDLRSPWSLSTAVTRERLSNIQGRRAHGFGDIAQIRVGIKTTSDAVFIRDDWDELPERIRPETELLRPLITHHTAACWLNEVDARRPRRVLYPHVEVRNGERQPIDLESYPRARAYLQQHRRTLESRRYLIEAGRRWYEIWVPQQPGDWSGEKIVYPDISEHPRFFLDTTGAVVNGDCYWITLKKGLEREWLLLLLAVANSTLATWYYDTLFHNKLYAGRRRFMTQYVREFPLPKLDGIESRRIIEMVSKAVQSRNPRFLEGPAGSELDALVWSSFGLSEKLVR